MNTIREEDSLLNSDSQDFIQSDKFPEHHLTDTKPEHANSILENCMNRSASDPKDISPPFGNYRRDSRETVVDDESSSDVAQLRVDHNNNVYANYMFE